MTAAHALQAPPRVFISYAHASDEHVEAVRTLWILLCRLGIDAQLIVWRRSAAGTGRCG